ncbi:MAG: DMT family transporter [Candidatus Puniceispirillaceae bacterium]
MSFLSWLYLLLLSFIWGASFYFIEVGLVYLSPAWLVCLRLTSAAIFLFGYVSLRGMFLPRSAHFWSAALVMGIINNLLPFFLIAWGQLFVTGGMASIINANTAFFGVIISAIFLRSEPLRLHRVFGVFLGILGVATVIGFDAAHSASASIIGSLAILLATLSYALAGVWGKLKLAGWPAIEVACGMLICSASLSVPASFLISGMPSFSLFQPANMLVLPQLVIGIGILGTALAYPLYFRILALAGASNLMLVTIIVPVFAVALDAAILGQWIGRSQLAGFMLVAVGLAIMDGRLKAKIAKSP